MALNLKKIKSAGIPKSGQRIVKLIKDSKLKPISFNSIKTVNGKTPKSINFDKMTKISKIPKSTKVKLIKKVIKEKKNVGF